VIKIKDGSKLKFVTDKNNNVCFEVLTIHYDSYHSSSYQPHFDTSDNVCLDLVTVVTITQKEYKN
jgi:hypothetical protein